ncbi:Charged multivesicular body protein 3 [Allomyces arbusculus]|nr:Charged multivesicular body protein 3 [Allomyces arbusculus]
MSAFIKNMLGIQSPEEQVKKWRQSIRAQERQMDRQIRTIQVEETKVKRSLQLAAKKGDKTVCKTLAKEIVRTRKVIQRLHTSKAQLNSVSMQLGHQLATLKVAGSLQKSTEIMKVVNRLVKLPEISAQMQEMSREMMKAGIIEEMIDDTITGLDEEDLEDEAEEEVEKVLFEVTDGLLGQGGKVGAELNAPVEEEVKEDPELLSRLNKLRMAS